MHLVRHNSKPMSLVCIKKSTLYGRGVFATQNIERGQRILTLHGKEIHCVVKDQETSLAYPNWVGLRKSTWLEVEAPAIYLNHSCNPNAGIRGSRQLIALKKIKVGEEVTFDYSTTEDDRLWHMKCTCGAKNCRKVVRSIQFLPVNYFRRYLPFVPTYFKKVYLQYTDRDA